MDAIETVNEVRLPPHQRSRGRVDSKTQVQVSDMMKENGAVRLSSVARVVS